MRMTAARALFTSDSKEDADQRLRHGEANDILKIADAGRRHILRENPRKVSANIGDFLRLLLQVFELRAQEVKETQQQVLFAGEIVEERSLGDVSSFGDLFNSCGGVIRVFEEANGGREDALRSLFAAALSSAWGFQARKME